ncbi:MAG: hypothetical protein H6581_10825 [Bacteroidia bacterium]|nr:hypothetical protein [Bacteroidia bacterium]
MDYYFIVNFTVAIIPRPTSASITVPDFSDVWEVLALPSVDFESPIPNSGFDSSTDLIGIPTSGIKTIVFFYHLHLKTEEKLQQKNFHFEFG